ncbi:MAG: hypothetical protein EMLJLAPB_01226 [Candidatus Argoarchaeum ethanivorans]|uniref:Uncharacterized protein n=1 Tax=Candidatus Argoarchaeum ethanivorans TaxID=2608793 RepID=A0A811TH75_9EURY|nr:MAG: hypothetical protein EMLJLAPB_01226 [Candidatus Argoarchaeum ethanivorans]
MMNSRRKIEDFEMISGISLNGTLLIIFPIPSIWTAAISSSPTLSFILSLLNS